MKKRVNGFNAAPGLAVWAASIVLAFGLNSATAGPPRHPPPKYTVIELKPLPGDAASEALNVPGVLNNRGQVVGGSIAETWDSSHACIWQNGMVTGLPPGPAALNFGEGINDWGCIVGISTTLDWDNAHGYVLVGRQWVQLPDLNATYCNAEPCGINNWGIIIGCVWKNLQLGGYEPPLPVVWRLGKIKALPILDLGPGHTPSGDTWAINDLDQIVGRSGDWFNDEAGVSHIPYEHATLWEHGKAIDLNENHDYSVAMDINNFGVATGMFINYDPTPDNPLGPALVQHPFAWTKQTGLVDLGTLPGYPYGAACGINDEGEIVGVVGLSFTETSSPMDQRAALWKGGMIFDLNACVPAGSGWNLYSATAINACGQILAYGVNSTGDTFSIFLLTPQRGH